jgi:hypothetical protein
MLGWAPPDGTLRLVRSASPSNALLTTNRRPQHEILLLRIVPGQVPEAM